MVPALESRPLGKVTLLAVAANRVFVGTAESAFVDVYALTGEQLGQVPVGLASRRPTKRDYERAVDGLVGMMKNRDQRERMKSFLLRYPMPEELPPYSRLFATSDTLWAVVSSPGDSVTRLHAVDGRGRSVSAVTIPRTLNVFEIRDNHVLGAYEDSNGQQHIAVYRLDR